MRSRLLDLPPHPFELARRLADRPGLMVLGPGYGSGAWHIGCDPCAVRAAWDPEPELVQSGASHNQAPCLPRWVGLLPYEATRGLERPGHGRTVEDRAEPHLSRPRWQRYRTVLQVGSEVRVFGEDESGLDQLCRLLGRPALAGRFSLRWAEPPENRREHETRIRAVLELVSRGEVYQVNLARRLSLRVEGHPLLVWQALYQRAPAPYAAYVDAGDVVVAGVSPELFLSLGPGGRVTTSPIKGTRPRSTDPEQDRKLAEELELDPKERAELTMVIDVERNDLGRVARPGSIRLVAPPSIQQFAFIHHRVATVEAELRTGVSRAELIRVMLPSGSVTGAPKVRAMEVIAQLEAHRRGLYTGAVGTLRHDGTLELGMAIRTLSFRGYEAHFFVGGGIVADSDPVREVEETEWKAAQLTGLLPPAQSDQSCQQTSELGRKLARVGL